MSSSSTSIAPVILSLVMFAAGFFSARLYDSAFSREHYWKKVKGKHAKKIYYAIGMGSGAVIAVWTFVTLSNDISRFRFVLFAVLLFVPIILIFLTDMILAGSNYTGHLQEEQEKKKTYKTLYDRTAVILRLLGYEDYWGHVSFRLDGIYAAEANNPEKLLKPYEKPLKDETQLKNVTDAFIRYIQENSFDIDQTDGTRIVDLLVTEDVHHDDMGAYRAFIAYGCVKDSIGPMVKGYGVTFLNKFFKDVQNKPVVYREVRGNGILYREAEAKADEPEKKDDFIPAIDSRNIAWQVRSESGSLYVYQGEKRGSAEPVYEIVKSTMDDNTWWVNQYRHPHDTAYTVVEFSDTCEVHSGVFTGRPAIYRVDKPRDTYGYVIEGSHITGNKLYIIRREKYDNVVYNLYHCTERWK